MADDPKRASPVLAFIIGLAIILLASILNAAGLNLTKLDHVRTSAIPKAARKKDWMRPLWLLGMLLYILSQLIGSTLALEYMRAEYVAPLGSTSLVFNFLFARFLVGTPVTSTDIYGTIVVIVGVIGIVAFGSINSGLGTETDVTRVTYLWRRGGWLGFFFAMTTALILVLIFTSRLDAVLAARSELSPVPFSGVSLGAAAEAKQKGSIRKVFGGIKNTWEALMGWVTERLEVWTAPKDDKTVAWTLGIGWACCGGGLAGGCLVFAKATVKLLSGSLSHENPGNQFGHAAPIFTIILLVVTAVMQIICLNHGLKVYDSTLVVPVFYGVYTATGFLNSLIFNDEVDSYQSWTLFLIFVSILILISGVVLLTHKKPEPGASTANKKGTPLARIRRKKQAAKGSDEGATKDSGSGVDLEHGERDREDDVLWAVGDTSDGEDEGEDEDEDHHLHPLQKQQVKSGEGSRGRVAGEEGKGLIENEEPEGEQTHGRPGVSTKVVRNPFLDEPEDFGDWTEAERRS